LPARTARDLTRAFRSAREKSSRAVKNSPGLSTFSSRRASVVVADGPTNVPDAARRRSFMTNARPELEAQTGRDIAQHFCDDVVLHASYFKPNAPGRWELSGLQAMSERQLLKGRGLYFASRVLLAATPVEVVAIAADATALVRTRRIRWVRGELRVELVPSRAFDVEEAGEALRLTRAGGSPGLEIAPLVSDAESSALIEYLLTGGRAGATPE
jgi:hypothetical protein